MFKRIRKFYKNNRIYCILMLISFICLVILGSALVIYFLNQATSDKYGPRMDGRDVDVIKVDMEEAKDYFEKAEGVLDVLISREGPTVYIVVDVEPEMTLAAMQSLATESLAVMSEEGKEQFELQFTFEREGKVPYEGSKPTSNTIISWSNYKVVEDTTTTTTKKK